MWLGLYTAPASNWACSSATPRKNGARTLLVINNIIVSVSGGWVCSLDCVSGWKCWQVSTRLCLHGPTTDVPHLPKDVVVWDKPSRIQTQARPALWLLRSFASVSNKWDYTGSCSWSSVIISMGFHSEYHSDVSNTCDWRKVLKENGGTCWNHQHIRIDLPECTNYSCYSSNTEFAGNCTSSITMTGKNHVKLPEMFR